MKQILIFSLLLISSKAIGQYNDWNDGFIDDCFIRNVYNSVAHNMLTELNEGEMTSVNLKQVQITSYLSDTIAQPTWLGKVYDYNPNIKLVDFDSTDPVVIDTARHKRHNCYSLVEIDIPIRSIANQDMKIDLEYCKTDCAVVLSFSTLFFQGEYIFGYVYIDILDEDIIKKRYKEPLIFELDNWDNLIKTKVRPIYQVFEESDLQLYKMKTFYQQYD